MNLKNIKLFVFMLFVLLAGILYSCNNKNEADVISVEEGSNLDVSTVSSEDASTVENLSNSNNSAGQVEDSININKDDDFNFQEANEEDEGLIYVHISGAVNNPGVYEAREQARVYELVEVAGGLTEDAAGDFVNQASIVEDGDQIYIPCKEEIETLELSLPTSSSNKSKTSQDETIKKVNINTASKEELMTLTGIGESKANSIIEYRQKHGSFSKIEDIMNISGIKEAAFSKISDYITVN